MFHARILSSCLAAFMATTVFLAAPTGPAAQEQGQATRPGSRGPITLTQYLDQLLREHDRVLASQAKVVAAERSSDRAQGDFLPDVDMRASAGYQTLDHKFDEEEDSYVDDSYDSEEFFNTQEVKATQNLVNFGRTTSKVNREIARLWQARLEHEATKQDVLQEAIEAYLAVIRAQDKLEYAQASERNLESELSAEERRLRSGAGVTTDVLQARSQLIGIRAKRVSAQGELANAKNRFFSVFHFMVSDNEVKRMVKPSVPRTHYPADLEEAVRIALEEHPRIKIARRRIMEGESERSMAGADFWPSLDLVAEGKRRERHEGLPGERMEGTGYVELNMNIFNGLSDYRAYQASKANLDALRGEYGNLQRKVEQQTRMAWQNLTSSRQVAETLENQVTVLEEFLKLARRERKLGTRSLLDVLTGEINLINARSTALAARTDHLRAAYELLYVLGRLTPENIQH
jgi:adhesin transport system outer membrane protein